MFNKKRDVHILIMEQIKDVERCFMSFKSFMKAALVPETPVSTLASLAHEVNVAEDKADKSLRAMIDSLSGGSYLPSTKEDLISIATSCDKVANKCETISNLITLYKLNIPVVLDEELNKIFEITGEQFAVLQTSIDMLFSNMYALQKDHAILDEIRALETKIDRLESSINVKVFDMDIELAAKMQLHEIIEKTADLSDIIEDIADKIQIMLIARKA